MQGSSCRNPEDRLRQIPSQLYMFIAGIHGEDEATGTFGRLEGLHDPSQRFKYPDSGSDHAIVSAELTHLSSRKKGTLKLVYGTNIVEPRQDTSCYATAERHV